jgi:hypothetical protein
MEKKTNTQFPMGATLQGNSHPYENGLTKREYFAVLAMQGLLTRVPKRQGGETDLGILEAKRIVAESRIIADLLIEELNEGGENE